MEDAWSPNYFGQVEIISIIRYKGFFKGSKNVAGDAKGMLFVSLVWTAGRDTIFNQVCNFGGEKPKICHPLYFLYKSIN